MVPRSAGSLLAPFRMQVETMDYENDADAHTADRRLIMERGTLPSYDSDGPRWPVAFVSWPFAASHKMVSLSSHNNAGVTLASL